MAAAGPGAAGWDWLRLRALYGAELSLGRDGAFVTHGAATFAALLGSWLLFCLGVEALAAAVPAVRASRLQPPGRPERERGLRAAAAALAARRWADIAVQVALFAPLLKLAFPLQQRHAMSWPEGAAFFLAWFVSNDALFTLFHRAFHESPRLYKFAHKQHHKWTAPFCWMSHAMSATEAGANGLAVMFWPLVHALVLRRTTPLELVWLVQCVSQLIGVIEHSGYAALNPLVVVPPDSEWLPPWLFSSTRHHDDHHRLFKGNYGGYLAVWDVLMGTVIHSQDHGAAACDSAAAPKRHGRAHGGSIADDKHA
eukprot:SAG22_NODE_55_length_23749_cov_24.622918_9_plen_311_part_00